MCFNKLAENLCKRKEFYSHIGTAQEIGYTQLKSFMTKPVIQGCMLVILSKQCKCEALVKRFQNLVQHLSTLLNDVEVRDGQTAFNILHPRQDQ